MGRKKKSKDKVLKMLLGLKYIIKMPRIGTDSY